MFNRIAICNAYYMFASLYYGGQGSKEYAYFARLDRIGYKPGLGAQSQDPNRLDDESREVFDRLVERFNKLVRSQPDSMTWKPSYTMGDGELWCHECDDQSESDS